MKQYSFPTCYAIAAIDKNFVKHYSKMGDDQSPPCIILEFLNGSPGKPIESTQINIKHKKQLNEVIYFLFVYVLFQKRKKNFNQFN